jgi:hypothetical protein
MELTVGKIEEMLRKYPKGTPVHLSCGCCNHSSSGNETILGIEESLNQTYGYITLQFNDSSRAEVELSSDKEEFYKKEISKLKDKISELNTINERVKENANSIKRNA